VAGNIDITLILSGEKMKRTPCGITWRGHPYCFYPDIHYIHLFWQHTSWNIIISG